MSDISEQESLLTQRQWQRALLWLDKRAGGSHVLCPVRGTAGGGWPWKRREQVRACLPPAHPRVWATYLLSDPLAEYGQQEQGSHGGRQVAQNRLHVFKEQLPVGHLQGRDPGNGDSK